MNYDSLKHDLLEESMGAYFCGGFGGALTEAESLEESDPSELLQFAEDSGMDLRNYGI